MTDIMKGPSEVIRSRGSIELVNAVAVVEKHGTQGDELDMDRMGKVQVLRVCWNKDIRRYCIQLTSSSAAIQIPVDIRLRSDSWQQLGIFFDVCYPLSNRNVWLTG